MTTGKRKSCPWTALAASLAALACACPPAWPQPAPPRETVTVEEEDLYLDIVLNQVPLRQIVQVTRRGERLFADAGVLRAMGLTWPGAASASGLVALDSLPGLRSTYDAPEQRLYVFVPVELLSGPATSLGYATPPVPELDPAAQAPGLLVNYDVYAQGDGRARSTSGWHEVRMFGVGRGVLRTSSVYQATHAEATGDQVGSVRLDTSWQFDDPARMVSVVLGDAYNSALVWTRTTRFGGLRVSRNFSLQPYRVVVPLASFAGEAVVPSAVDLYINGIREAQGHVGPGRFEAVSAPLLNGAGQAQMVITDITGQSRVIDFNLYNSARLLQQGLNDWSLEVGALRRDYGLRSNVYADKPMTTGSLRHGVTDQFTAEAHGEFTADLAMGGLGAVLLVDRRWGVVSASYAASRHASRQGHQYGASYEWQGPRLNVNVATLRRGEDFRDVASLDGATLPRRTDQAFVGVTVGRGQIGASYVRQDQPLGARTSYANVSWTHSFEARGNVSIGVSRDLDGESGTQAHLYWSMPLGDRHHAWISLEQQRQGNTATAGAMRTLPGDRDGWGWRVEADAGEKAGAAAEVAQLTRFGMWRVGAQHWKHHGTGGSTVGYANANGGLLWMDRGLFPMRRVYDAFALVSTDGIAGVPVMLENRFIGTTDRNGQLLVTPLNAWENNDLSIDPLVLPDDVSVRHVRLAAVPATGSGVLARFPMRAQVVVELSLRDANGQWVAAGSPVTLAPGGHKSTVGYDGRVYLEDPPAGGRVTVSKEYGTCSVDLPRTLPPRGRINLGELPCR